MSSTKPYYTFSRFCLERFGGKAHKIALDAGFTCPNIDGHKGYGGCAFCSPKGSGDFALAFDNYRDTHGVIEGKYRGKPIIPYFQAHTNTYAPPEQLREIFAAAASLPNAVAISIATRPDCVNEQICEVLSELARRTFIFIELGLQSSNDATKRRMNCLHTNVEYEAACSMLRSAEVNNIVSHVILGLPGESRSEMIASALYAAKYSDGIKLQLLHVLKDTALADMYYRGEFEALSFEDYTEILAEIICRLPENTVIHRLTGDGDKQNLIAPKWSADKKRVLNALDKYMREKWLKQGLYYESGTV